MHSRREATSEEKWGLASKPHPGANKIRSGATEEEWKTNDFNANEKSLFFHEQLHEEKTKYFKCLKVF